MCSGFWVGPFPLSLLSVSNGLMNKTTMVIMAINGVGLCMGSATFNLPTKAAPTTVTAERQSARVQTSSESLIWHIYRVNSSLSDGRLMTLDCFVTMEHTLALDVNLQISSGGCSSLPGGVNQTFIAEVCRSSSPTWIGLLQFSIDFNCRTREY